MRAAVCPMEGDYVVSTLCDNGLELRVLRCCRMEMLTVGAALSGPELVTELLTTPARSHHP